MNIGRKIALAILDADKTRLGGANKRLIVGWNDTNLIKITKKFIAYINDV